MYSSRWSKYNKQRAKARKHARYIENYPYLVVVFDKQTNFYIEKKRFKNYIDAVDYVNVYKEHEILGAYLA